MGEKSTERRVPWAGDVAWGGALEHCWELLLAAWELRALWVWIGCVADLA